MPKLLNKAEKEKQAVEALLNEEDKKVPVNPRQELLSSLSHSGANDFKKLFEENLKFVQIKVGDIVTGTIVGFQTDFVMVDVGYKSEGMIPVEDFKFAGVEQQQSLESGQKVEVYIERMENENGMVVLSKNKADMMRAWNDICQIAENEEEIEGKVVAKVKGGLSVDIGVKAFLPGSQIDLRPIRDMDAYVGNVYKFKVIKFNKKRGNIVLSRRVLLEKKRDELRHQTESLLKEGNDVKGFVKNLTEYGAFVDLGGIDGLLHITDMSWGRIQHPSDLVKVGDEITVKILKYSEEKQRASLGLKQLTPDPWFEFKNTHSTQSPNNRITGKVISIMDYGAFVELGKGVEGLIHISEMSWNKKVKHPSQILTVGEQREVVILEINEEQRRISLGIKQLEENPWLKLQEAFPLGKVVEGHIKSITDFGLFVDVGADIDGLIRNSDISWAKKSENFKELFTEGQKVEAKVLLINTDQGRFSLGIKQLEGDPWEKVDEIYPIGSQHEVKVQNLMDFGAFVQLDEKTNMQGLIHISELSLSKNEKASDVIQVGQVLKVEVISIDKNARKIGLSTHLRSGTDEMDVTRKPESETETKAQEKEETGTGMESEAKAKTESHGEEKWIEGKSSTESETQKGSLIKGTDSKNDQKPKRKGSKSGRFSNLFGEGLKKLTEKRGENSES